ncbi:phage-related infection protein [Companilactobacillus nantensis DSM 16982]|uniref:Phage-related infection protein n=2 Tax=Companilactobacillus nantensis TaxID=305793 RepID=A0A0R1WPS4_9LACO|nr:phage-related infection protein [Companilactobacillus nantensis DSM 16982]
MVIPMLKAEWTYLIKNKMFIVVLIAIALIPAIYCYLYLSSMWNTYGKTDNIPVAVVNQDRRVEYNGKDIAIGSNLSKNLKKSDSLNFKTMSYDKAEKNLKNGKVYMTVIIPKNFSKNATTILTKNPQKMTIKYRMNSGQNFIVSKITNGAATSIKQNVSKQVTQLYSKIILSALNGATVGMNQAASGNYQLAGIPNTNVVAKAGNQKISNSLVTGAQRLAQISTDNQNAQILSSPIKEDVTDIAKVPNNGTGMAPFAIAIGLYVGGIALGTMYDGYDPRKYPRSAFSWWFSKASVIGIVATIQSIVLWFTLIKFNNLVVKSQSVLFLELLLGSSLFLSLIFCLRNLLGGFGTWLVSIVLVLQLASSGGLYPTQLLSPFAKAMNQWLPMTYLINALRATISTSIPIQNSLWTVVAITVGLNLLIIARFKLAMIKNPIVVGGDE